MRKTIVVTLSFFFVSISVKDGNARLENAKERVECAAWVIGGGGASVAGMVRGFGLIRKTKTLVTPLVEVIKADSEMRVPNPMKDPPGEDELVRIFEKFRQRGVRAVAIETYFKYEHSPDASYNPLREEELSIVTRARRVKQSEIMLPHRESWILETTAKSHPRAWQPVIGKSWKDISLEVFGSRKLAKWVSGEVKKQWPANGTGLQSFNLSILGEEVKTVRNPAYYFNKTLFWGGLAALAIGVVKTVQYNRAQAKR
ncbi:MAG: hypothetical protein HY401_02060 [Elusimicrobia bacterium]|nr:hypothetical protein [Elusimicrobiota bacterium]